MRWNQLLQVADATKESNGVAFVSSSDGTVVANGTASASTYATIIENIPVTGGHVYLLRGVPAGGSTTTYRGYVQGTPFDSLTNRYDYGNGVIVTAVSSGTAKVVPLYLFSGYAANNLTAKPQLFDLTLMFGAGNEPSTVAEFEALYPASYYPYSAPTLRSAKPTGIESVGFNLWDGTWEGGQYSSADGSKTSNANKVRSAGTIAVFANTTYYYRGVANTVFYFYDGSGNYLSYHSVSAGTTFTTPEHTMAMTFAIGSSGNPQTSMPPATVCINLSGPRNGEYEPYWSQSISIPIAEIKPEGLRSAGDGSSEVCDELTNDALVTRVGAVDLGTLTWTEGSNDLGQYFYSSGITDCARPSAVSVKPNMDCAKYETVAPNDLHYGSITVTTSGLVFVRDLQSVTYTDAAAFKAAMDGVLLFYELATPTTTPIDPPLNMTYRTEAGGTEEFIIPEGHISAPPITEISYGVNAMDGIADSLARISKAESNINNISDHF